MSWAELYLICFLVGLSLSAISMLSSSLHLHLPHWLHGPHGRGLHVHRGGTGRAGAGRGRSVTPVSFATVTTFLAWFGGAGLLLTEYSRVWIVTALGVAVLAGLVGAFLVFRFLQVLVERERHLDPADFEMSGVLAQVCSGIREGGTGEIIYSLQGSRHTCGARSEENMAIPKGTQVVVLRMDRGLAYVKPLEEV